MEVYCSFAFRFDYWMETIRTEGVFMQISPQKMRKIPRSQIWFVPMYFSRYGECQRRDEATEDLLHPLSNSRIRKRIPLQSVPDKKTANRNSPRFMPHWKTDKNLVSKPTDEVEKRTQDGQYEYRSLSHVPLRTPLSIWLAS